VSSFGGVNFEAVGDGWNETSSAAVSVRGFPGGNNVAISLAGQREVKRTISCVFDDRGQYVSLVLLRGAEHDLVIDNWDTVSAVLTEVSGDPPLTDGKVRATAQFVLT
jgi:hypothetical protein